jgi:CubicO group peptidase (beta-lactamase class C family)
MLALLLACHKTPPLPDPPTLDERMAYLSQTLAHYQEEQGIPGMAVAVTWKGEVIFRQGFGVADVDAQTPVGPDTPFAVGSTTKAFTTALIAARVASGQLDWDDPVADHIDGFTLSTGDPATVRDLLSHRTGLTRMPMAWGVSDKTVLTDLLDATAKAELWGDWQETWHYNNVMYAIAGSLVGDYNTALDEELLAPLGMDNSFLGVPENTVGYRIEDGEPVPVQTRDLSGVMAPAGALSSTADDMILWAQYQLAAEGALAHTHEPVFELGPGNHYALGWMVAEESFGTVVEHGGNIEGFSAHIALVPEEELGLVWMSNVMLTPLQSQVRSVVVDAVIGDDWWIPAAHGDLGRYTGDYDAAFVRDTFTVVEDGNGLAIDIPGQSTFGLRSPDDDGLWAFKLTKQIKVEFVEENGEVVGLVMHQGGLEMAAPREGHIPTDSPARYQPYLGRYTLGEETLEVKVVHGHMALDMPSQLVYGLEDPDKKELWVFMETDDISVRFETDEGGTITGLTLLQDGEEHTAPRLEQAGALPTEDDIRALLGDIPTNCREEGSVRFVHQGVEGTWVTEWGEDFFSTRLDVASGVDGAVITEEKVEVISDFQEDLTLVGGPVVSQSWSDFPGALEGDLTVLGTSEVDGRAAWEVLRTSGEHPPDTLFIDAETGEVLQRNVELVTPYLASMRIPQTMRMYDHVDGAPTRITIENVHTGVTELTTTSLVCDDDLVLSETGLPEPAAPSEPPAEAEGEASE